MDPIVEPRSAVIGSLGIVYSGREGVRSYFRHLDEGRRCACGG
jgi:hypothetical protein